MYNKPITIQVQDPNTEEWADVFKLHASVNKTGGGTNFSAGADQHNTSLTFKVRYFRSLESIAYNTQPYRVIYRGNAFKIVDYDDYMEQHREIKLVGEYYG